MPVLHSDRDLEAFQKIYLGFFAEPTNTTLAHEYVNLFSHLTKAEDCPEDLTQAIGLPPDVQSFPRDFRCEKRTGALINPKDESRNVAFKVETFQLLLEGIEKGVKREDFEGILRAAGYNCGKVFGEALNDSWKGKTRAKSRSTGANFKLGQETRISRWCQFDSDVGFGRFSVAGISMTNDQVTKCEITLRESFLTPARDLRRITVDGDHYCMFMAGYIQGVLEKILGAELSVSHKLSGYESDDARSMSSIYVVSRKRRSTKRASAKSGKHHKSKSRKEMKQ
jgi:hypothetical protein